MLREHLCESHKTQPNKDQTGARKSWWAHNPQVRGPKPCYDIFYILNMCKHKFDLSLCKSLDFTRFVVLSLDIHLFSTLNQVSTLEEKVHLTQVHVVRAKSQQSMIDAG